MYKLLGMVKLLKARIDPTGITGHSSYIEDVRNGKAILFLKVRSRSTELDLRPKQKYEDINNKVGSRVSCQKSERSVKMHSHLS